MVLLTANGGVCPTAKLFDAINGNRIAGAHSSSQMSV